MQFFTTAAAISLLTLSANALPTVLDASEIKARDGKSSYILGDSNTNFIDESLIPAFHIQTGANKTDDGTPIPSWCPPPRQDFINLLNANVHVGNVLGTPITFELDASIKNTDVIKARGTAMVITVQNFNGTFGVGCPGKSVPELIDQQKNGVQAPAPA